MRHRKIPTKNRKKLKQVDPFNKNASSLKLEKIKGKNVAPLNVDDQPIPRSLRELQESSKLVDQKSGKVRKQKNSILREAEKLGLTKGKFETMGEFMRRLDSHTYSQIQAHKIKVDQGLAGRKLEEIEEEMKQLEEKEMRAKEQKKREIQNAIKRAKEEREAKERRIQGKVAAKRKRHDERDDDETGHIEIEPVERKEREEDDKDSAYTETGITFSKEKRMKVSKKNEKKSMKIKERKETEQKAKVLDAILYSKEVIKFGERYDAPPQFAGDLKKKLDPLTAKAGGKNLLLHSMLKKTSEPVKYLENTSKTEKPNEIDRQKVIAAYRDLKKRRVAVSGLTPL